MAKPATAEKTILESLDDYWFGQGSLTTIGVFRILMGTIITTNLALLGLQWNEWFSEKGWVPAYAGMMDFPHQVNTLIPGVGMPRLDLIGSITDPRITIPFYAIVFLAAVLTTVGLWTRVSSIILAVGIVSLHHRNGLILHGGDTVFRLSAIYLAVGPSGRACSIDRLLRVFRGLEPPTAPIGSLWMQRIISYEVAIVYFTTMWLKYWGSHWRDGTATWYTARLPEFIRFPVPEFMINPPFTTLSTYGTLAVEFALATLVFFRPCRKWVLLAGILMHGYIEWTMNIPLFAFAMCSMYVSFYDGEEVSGFFERLGKRFAKFAITVKIPKRDAASDRIAAILHVVDPLRLLSVERSDVTKPVALDSGGKELPLVPALTWRNPGLVALSLSGALSRALSGKPSS